MEKKEWNALESKLQDALTESPRLTSEEIDEIRNQVKGAYLKNTHPCRHRKTILQRERTIFPSKKIPEENGARYEKDVFYRIAMGMIVGMAFGALCGIITNELAIGAGIGIYLVAILNHEHDGKD